MAGPEKNIQTAVVDRHARKKYKGKVIVRKQTVGRSWSGHPTGTNGYPDYEFNAIGAHTWFMEFKAPGKKLTPLQTKRKAELEALGYRVYACDDAAKGRTIVDKEMEVAVRQALEEGFVVIKNNDVVDQGSEL